MNITIPPNCPRCGRTTIPPSGPLGYAGEPWWCTCPPGYVNYQPVFVQDEKVNTNSNSMLATVLAYDAAKTECAAEIAALRSRAEAAEEKVGNLAALVRMLVHSLRKVNPNSSNIIRAMDYLTRKGLTGSILRDDEPQPQEIPESGGHLESADCWCGPTVEEHPGGTLIIHNQTH